MLLPAHSHRDSDLKEPLVWAIEHRFASVEADVWFVDGDLRIGHERSDVTPERTLESIYLRPLFKAVTEGRVEPTLTLLVDIKNAPVSVYRLLRKQLEPYREYLTRLEYGVIKDGAVRVLLSGDRPIKHAVRDANRLVFIDGRLPDVGADPKLFPTVSLDWQGRTENEVRRLAKETHAAGQTLRFWGTGEDPATWETLLDLGVDLINGDDVVAMTEFLKGLRSG